ncbi:hypothetical protein BJ165DRAFT_1468156 [Panaeolus papilionaceus]|nr:hypothetical protein BJ165DRAFT_1468156 [Panaeolus papilionaceus]
MGFVYDALLFFAVVFRVFQCSTAGTNDMKTTVETFVFGRYLSTLSKALLQNGQAYFMSTFAIGLTTLVLYYIDSLPQAYRLVLGLPGVVVINIMACKIYRNTRLGIFELPSNPQTAHLTGPLRFSPPTRSQGESHGMHDVEASFPDPRRSSLIISSVMNDSHAHEALKVDASLRIIGI